LAIVGIIPARYGSARPPGALLSDILGQTPIGRERPRVSIARTLRVDGPGLRTRVAPAEGRRGADIHTPEALERGRAPRAPEKGRVA
jgi:hypothetical protein